MQTGLNPQGKNGIPRSSFPLAFAAEGETVKIVLIRGRSLRERLLGLGIHLDNKVMIVRKQDGGAILLAHDHDRIILGSGMAHKINVIRC